MSLHFIQCYLPKNSIFPSLPSQSRPPLLTASQIRAKNVVVASIPARDRVIDFGRHKGSMLGTLPSKYLKWVSRNLRAREFEEWARLADEVLEDPVYRDRLEWEVAERVLMGEFEGGGKMRGSIGGEEGGSAGGRRVERRERQRLRRDAQVEKLSKDGVYGVENCHEGYEDRNGRVKGNSNLFPGRDGLRREVIDGREVLRDAQVHKLSEDGLFDVETRRKQYEDRNGRVEGNSSPFPGRESLLRKVLDSRKTL
ncbi:hypothetical protein Sjap_023032 [Stephania japonica]|uniref:Uncharacterized protein n=1 Tax=Stephania japonica TaxID=461633 RepID=A0AAP0ESK6_9MAGN